MDRSSATTVLHPTTIFKPPYRMDVWVGLKLDWYVTIQYAIDSGVGSHKSVFFHLLTDGMNIFLKNGIPTAITNSYKALLMQFIPNKFYIDARTREILYENPLIKFHPKTIARDQLIANTTRKNSYNFIPKIARLNLTFRCWHNFATKDDGYQFFFGNKNVIHKGREVWCHIEIILVKKDNYMADYKIDYENICNVRVHIKYEIRMTRGMVDVEDVNSGVVAEYIEEEEKDQKQHIVEKQKQLLTEQQSQGLAAMDGG